MSSQLENAPIFAVTHEFAPTRGGIATFTEEMARAAHALGRQVEVWAPRHDAADAASDASQFPFPIKRLPLRGSQDFTCQLKLARELVKNRRRIRNAVLYLSDPGPILAMCLLQYFKALRPAALIITFHGSEIQSFAAHPGKRFAVGKLIAKADRLSTPSEYTHQLLRSHFPEAGSKTFLTPGALRSNFEEVEARTQRSNQQVTILTVGRIHPRKGQANTLAAIRALPPELRRKVTFSIVGTGSKHGYEKELRRLAAEVDFAVEFHGDVSEERLLELYAQADIFAMTSVHFRRSVEGFGLVYLEAAAHGLPIIAHRIGGVAEAVSHGENGILVDPGQEAELTAAFAQLVGSAALRERMGRNGTRWARRNCWRQSAALLFNRWDITIDPQLLDTNPSTPANAANS